MSVVSGDSFLSISLNKKPQVPNLTLKGIVSGITTKDKDGWIDFSVALDSLTKNDVKHN